MSKKPIYLLLIIILSLSLIGWFSYLELGQEMKKSVQAAAADNVSGWAWSENIGWISFNNLNGAGSINYGVNIDSQTGNFSGYAWSENIGWIQFAPAGPYPASPNYSVKVDLGTKQITGWARARALAYGDNWDGWIKFGYGPQGSYIDENSDFHGWAWGSDVVGWISLNHADGEAGGKTLYKVGTTTPAFNQPPSASNLQANLPDCCQGAYPSFSWTFTDPDGDNQSAYQVRVDNNSDFSSPEIDSGKILSSSNAYAPTIPLSWNTKYYWRLKVWDSKDAYSDWISGPSFDTPSHVYPTVQFSWTPQKFKVGEEVTFTDQSTTSDGLASRYWTFEYGDPATSVDQNPKIKFTHVVSGGNRVILRITDSDGYTCFKEERVGVALPLPKWKEIPPTIWLKNFFANIGNFFREIL